MIVLFVPFPEGSYNYLLSSPEIQEAWIVLELMGDFFVENYFDLSNLFRSNVICFRRAFVEIQS